MSETSSENSRNTNLNTHIFPYRTLAPGEIRVLTIHPPRTTDRNEPIRCSLDHCPLLPSSAARTFPRYEWGDYFALSYCWGADAQNPSRKITIDDHAVKVTENLEAALQTLRASSMSTAGPWPVRFWVDAVCLNQSDSEEVKAEILRMRDIYSQAAGVYSHLGLATEDSDVGFRFMHLMAEGLFQSADMVYRELVDRRFSGKDPEKNAYKAMLRLLNRPYWHRVWVLQELAMSHGSVTVGCGSREMPLDKIRVVSRFVTLNAEAVMFFIGALDPEIPQLFNMALSVQSYTLTWATGKLEYRDIQQSVASPHTKYLSLRQPLLTLAQSAQATRSHDNVYGLLGLMPDPISKRIESYIDYDLQATEVFLAFSKAIIEYTGSLDVIFAKSFSQTMEPSWATDWSKDFDRAGVPHDWDLYNYDQFEGAYPDLRNVIDSSSIYRADAGRAAIISFSPDNDSGSLLLNCSGICIGAVDGMAFPPSGGANSSRMEHVQPVSTLNPYGDEEATVKALIHTIYANPIWGDTGGASLFHIPWVSHHEDPSTYFLPDGVMNVTPADVAYIQELQTHGWDSAMGNGFTFFEWWRRHLSQFRIGGKNFQEYFDSEVTDMIFPAERVKLDMVTANGAHISRCLITLDTGHFGLAPYTVEKGDKVFVLVGCSMPVILRPVGATARFRVVGECYVDGYAKGEVWNGVERGEFEVRDVVLC